MKNETPPTASYRELRSSCSSEAMKRILSFLLVAAATTLALAAAPGEFERLSVLAAKRYTRPTPGGSEYATKFSDWSTQPMVRAMNVCAATPPSNLYCDIITIVSADGHIRKVLFAPSNAYTTCVRKNLKLGLIAPKPPAAEDWPVQIRLYDGARPKYNGEAFIMLSQHGQVGPR